MGILKGFIWYMAVALFVIVVLLIEVLFSLYVATIINLPLSMIIVFGACLFVNGRIMDSKFWG